MRKNLKLSLFALLALFAGGCISQQRLDARIQSIRDKHNVEVKAGNPLSRCYLFGNLPGLLDRIDKDLEKCPDYFKENLGEVIIEEWFFDNPDIYKELIPPVIIRGYVDNTAKEEKYPIHIKNRGLMEKILLFAPRDNELFSHESAHSFTFNAMWDEKVARKFFKNWEEFVGEKISLYFFVGQICPPVSYIRPKGTASSYGSLNPLEDMAETHCYLLRHENIEFLKEKDPVLYKKCKVWKDFTEGRNN